MSMTELIARNIRAQRLAQGMTQEELATKIFTTRQTVSNYETGKSKPDYETVGKIAAALGVSAEVLLYDSSNRRKKVKVWWMLAATGFVFILARSFRFSSLLVNNDCMPGYLTYAQGYIMVLIPAVCAFGGYISLRLYELYVRKSELRVNHAKIGLILSALLFAAWFLAAFAELPKIYEAASDPVKNQYGGPAMLSDYIETFYYRYIFRMVSQLPILNSFFVLLGGFAAVCANGENV